MNAAVLSTWASTLDWSNYTWTAGVPTASHSSVYQSFDVDNSYASGSEITVSVTNNNSNLSWYSSGSTTYPRISNSPVTNDTVLQLYANKNNTTGGITTKIFFNYSTGVKNVSFTLYDVDASGTQFVDLISNIYAVTVTGQIVAATAITTSTDNTLSGTGTNSTVKGTANSDPGTSDGNVTITFNTTEAIRYVTFTWSNLTYSGAQAIGVGNITYTIAPEVGVGQASLIVCLFALAAGALAKWRRRSRPNAAPPSELVTR